MANWGLFLDIAITNGPCSVSPRNEPRIMISVRHRWPRREPGDFGSVRPHSSRWSRGRVREAPLPISLHIPYKRHQWQATYGCLHVFKLDVQVVETGSGDRDASSRSSPCRNPECESACPTIKGCAIAHRSNRNYRGKHSNCPKATKEGVLNYYYRDAA